MDNLTQVYRRCIYCDRGAFGDLNEHYKVCPKYVMRIKRVKDYIIRAHEIMKIQNYRNPRGKIFGDD